MELKVGMVLYEIPSLRRYPVTRCTEKRAFCKVTDLYEICFDKEQIGLYCMHPRGRDSYNRNYFSVETEELKQRKKLSNLVKEYKDIIPEKLNTTQLELIIKIAKEGDK